MLSSVDAYIALGTNLGDRGLHLRTGLAALRAAGLPALEQSAVWETEPVDSPSPLWYWNMAVRVDSDAEPLELLRTLLGIEVRAGRRRSVRNAPRTLDLDLLLFGDHVMRSAELTLPHARMWRRRFVLEPLAEIAPHFCDPASGATVLERCRLLRGGEQARRLGALASL